MSVLHGSCLYRGVRFEITGPLIAPRNCHCSMCRKQHGAAFRSPARVQTSDLKWIQGEDLVTFYESSPGSYRGFCRVCGPRIINKFDERALAAKIDPQVPSRYGVGLAPWTTIPVCVQPVIAMSPARPPGLR